MDGFLVDEFISTNTGVFSATMEVCESYTLGKLTAGTQKKEVWKMIFLFNIFLIR